MVLFEKFKAPIAAQCPKEDIRGRFQGSFISMTGLDNPLTLTIEKAVIGIMGERCALTVDGIFVTDVDYGISSKGSIFQPISIINNTINAGLNGIGISMCDLSGYIDISNNIISMDNLNSITYATSGISCRFGGWTGSWNKFDIKCNEINLVNCKSGIVVSAFNQRNRGRKLHVTDNDVNINENDYTSDGILFESVTYGTLYNNHVIGSDPSSSNSTNAYRIQNSPLSLIQQNYSDATRVGINFEGTSNSSDLIRGNIMNDHYHGMELQLTGVLGTQAYSGNQWTGYNSSTITYEPAGSGNFIAAWADPGFSFSNLLQSRFTINGSINSEYYPYNNHVPLNTDWFLPGGGSNQTYSSPSPCTNLLSYTEIETRYLDSLIVNDSSLTSIYADEIKKVSAFHLRDKLELLRQGEDISSYFNNFLFNFSLTASGKISRYRDTLLTLAPMGSDSIEFIIFSDSALKASIQEVIDLMNQGDESDDGQFSPLNSNLRGLNGTWLQSYTMLSNQINLTLFDLLDGITTSHVIDFNLKNAYRKVPEFLTGITNLENFIDSLELIAYQCVYEGGPGVVISRNLLAAVGDQTIYNDDYLCNAERQSYFNIDNKMQISDDINVFPNPSSGWYHIQISNYEQGEKNPLEVYDLAGKVVYVMEVKNSISAIDLSHLQSGIYHLKASGARRNANIKIVKL